MGAFRDPLERVPERVTFVGDLHMSERWAVTVIHHAKDSGAGVIIQLGDFGYSYYPRFLRPVSRALDETGLQLLFVDGNQEDFAKLYARPRRSDGLRLVEPNIWHLPRGFRWEWDGVRFLALGGAHSIDRTRRKQTGDAWWPEETITEDQAAAVAAAGETDVMVTHDCPAGVDIPGIDANITRYSIPQYELVEADLHRRRMRGIVDAVRPASLWHGHYHVPYAQTVDFGWPMHVVGLDRDKTSLRANTVTVALDQLRPGAAGNVAELVGAGGQQ